MFRSQRSNDWIAICFGSEPDGAVLVQDIWFFNMTYVSVRRLWRQIQIWNGQFAGDTKYSWSIMPRPYKM